MGGVVKGIGKLAKGIVRTAGNALTLGTVSRYKSKMKKKAKRKGEEKAAAAQAAAEKAQEEALAQAKAENADLLASKASEADSSQELRSRLLQRQGVGTESEGLLKAKKKLLGQ